MQVEQEPLAATGISGGRERRCVTRVTLGHTASDSSQHDTLRFFVLHDAFSSDVDNVAQFQLWCSALSDTVNRSLLKLLSNHACLQTANVLNAYPPRTERSTHTYPGQTLELNRLHSARVLCKHWCPWLHYMKGTSMRPAVACF